VPVRRALARQTKETMMNRVKKILLWVLVAFAIYAIITSPDQAAEIVRTSWSILADGVRNIGNFFDALLGRE
jgi:divalent metal cation (Fe/Co/Zn/Cd) transporter